MPLAESVHELLELSGTLDLEEDLIVVIRHFDVEMLGWSWLLWGWTSVVGHLGGLLDLVRSSSCI